MADYSKMFVAERPLNEANINQNMIDVQEYSNILTGNTSKMLNAPVKSLGRVYAYNTNETCIDSATLAQVPRYSVIDSMPELWRGGGFLNSANSDFEKSKSDINYVINADKFPMQCMSVPIIETDINGKSTTNPYYIMIAEIDKLSTTLFPGGKKPALPYSTTAPTTSIRTTTAPTTTDSPTTDDMTTYDTITETETDMETDYESFINMKSVTSVASLENMDPGQKFFVGSLGVIGLYIYFKMIYGHSK